MKHSPNSHSMQLQQELHNTHIALLIPKVLQPRQTSLRTSILRPPGSMSLLGALQAGVSCFDNTEGGVWSRKRSFAQCLPAELQSLAQILFPRRTPSRNPVKAAEWSIHKPERTIQLSHHGISEPVLGSCHL